MTFLPSSRGRLTEHDLARFPGATEVITLDGLRAEYADGFGLARASNTTPVIVLRFEAQDAAGLARIQAEFRQVLLAAKPDSSVAQNALRELGVQ